MNITLSGTLLNCNNNRPSSFSIKQSRLGVQNNVIAKDYALLSDKKNISYKLSFALESSFESNFEANSYALNHSSFLSSLSTFSLEISEDSKPKKKKYSSSFDNSILTNFSFSTTNNTVIFNYEFLTSTINFNTENE
ncbi:MAG: hypothetical protein R3Y46_01635 [Opitutales bacterium]